MLSLNKREKILLQLLLLIVVSLALYFLIITPFFKYQQNIQDSSSSSLIRLNKLERIYKKYKTVKTKKNDLNKLLKNTKGITSLIEENARLANILKNKAYSRDYPSNIKNKYQKVTTDIKFESVDIESILKFIHHMEQTDKIVKISYLKISEALKESKTYDVTIKFESYTIN